MSSLMMVYRVAPYQHLFKRDWGQSSPNTYCNILPPLALNAPGYFTAKLEGRSGDWTGEEWFVIMFGGRVRGGVKAYSTHWRLEPVRDGSQACAPESGKERAEERGLGRARAEGRKKRRQSVEKLWKRSCVSSLHFQFWSFKAKLF